MPNNITCCNVEQVGRVFYISPNGSKVRRLVFLDECFHCGQPIAIIEQIDNNGKIKQIIRKTGNKALELLKLKIFEKNKLLKLQYGNKSNMCWFWFDGAKDLWVRDFNNKKCFKLSLN